MSSSIFLGTLQYRTKKQKELVRMLRYDSKIRTQINMYIEKAIRPYVPMSAEKKSVHLRNSAIVTERGIRWGSGLPYARYQFMGQVYGPNFPIKVGEGENVAIIGWRSRKGQHKHPTGRELGVPGSLLGWTFGYTTPGTRHHWTRAYTDPYSPVKRKTNLEITNYLKKQCRARGLNV